MGEFVIASKKQELYAIIIPQRLTDKVEDWTALFLSLTLLNQEYIKTTDYI